MSDTEPVDHDDVAPIGERDGDPARGTDIGDPRAPISRNIAAELVGTLIVMLTGPGVLVLAEPEVGTFGAAVGFGIGIAVAIGVIGAVANPAFTLALLLAREVRPQEALGDWIGQLLGGIGGAAIIWGINDQTRVAIGANGWDRNGLSGPGAVIAAELVFAVVVVVVLLSSIANGSSTAAIAGFTGLAYGAAHLVLIPISGGGLNPARSIGSAIFSDADPHALGQVWVFVVVPLIGAVAALFVWLAVHEAEIDDTVFDDTLIDPD